MTLPARTRLGPYELLAPIGTGGMGEVYRATDPRLGREVAIKVLPERFASDPDSRQRFEQEARAASALAHPNIVVVYDIGTAPEGTYIAMELIGGRTLRELLSGQPMPPKKLLEIASQVADGLAKAHAVGIVHRDLKPENVMVSEDGFVKILDFGLAKLMVLPTSGDDVETTPQLVRLTEPGKLVGTVGYMSPEQAADRNVDHRSDQFSLGAILYEMATGRRAFQKRSAVETMNAIINDEPVPPASLNPSIPVPLRWTIERCLAKDREERYASTWDLARELRAMRDHLSEISSVREAAPPSARGRTSRPWPFAAAVAGALALAAAVLALSRAPGKGPVFSRVTFRRGWISSARFVPDGHGVVYGASWEGKPMQIVSARLGDPESRTLFQSAELLAISSSGEMAVMLDPHWALGEFISAGTLAKASLAGGAPRPLLEDVQAADWSPDGRDLAVVRDVGSKSRLEYPIGSVLFETVGWISWPRVSPSGDEVAFLDHPVRGDDGGSVAIARRGGGVQRISAGWSGLDGLAWSRSKGRLWVTGARTGFTRYLYALPRGGTERLALRLPETLTVRDEGSDGRLLLTEDISEVGIAGVAPGAPRERTFSWFDFSQAEDLSSDGDTLLFQESGEASDKIGVYVRKTDGSPAVRLGDAWARALSPDKRWVLAVGLGDLPRPLLLLPTGAGQPRVLAGGAVDHERATWFPDGRRVLFSGREPGGLLRLFVQDVAGGAPRPLGPAGLALTGHTVSPDGARVAALEASGVVSVYPVDGGPPAAVKGLEPREVPIRWSADGRSLFVYRRGGLPCRLARVDVETGRRENVADLMPADPTGIQSIGEPQITPDGLAWTYTYNKTLSTLYVVEGIDAR